MRCSMIFLDSTYLIGLILKNDSLYYKSPFEILFG